MLLAVAAFEYSLIFENIELRTKIATLSGLSRTSCGNCAVSFKSATLTGYDCGTYYLSVAVDDDSTDANRDYLKEKPECKKIVK